MLRLVYYIQAGGFVLPILKIEHDLAYMDYAKIAFAVLLLI